MRRIRLDLSLLLLLLAGAPGHAADPAAPLWHRSVSIATTIRPDGSADTVETWSVRADTTAVAHIVAQQSYTLVSDLETVTLLQAATSKADGTRIPVQPGAVMEQGVTTSASAPQFSATTARTIVFPAVAAGDTVEYTLLRHGTASLFPGEFTATMQPGSRANLERVDISLALPPGMELRVASKLLVESEPEARPDGGRTRRWSLAPKGSGTVLLDVSSFADYAELGRAYAARAWPRSHPGPAIRALALRLTQGIADRREQALRVYRHVATETRYVGTFLGEGRVVPRDAERVLAEGFGDCKDHAALLQAMLAALGIEAQPALISLRPLYSLPDAPGLGALNHVITYVPELDLFLDSTAPYAPFGLLPAGEYDKPVVLASPGAARLARTPAVPPVPLEVTTSTRTHIDAGDTLSGTTTTVAAGPQSIALRSMAAWIEGRGPQGAASLQLRQLGTPGTGGFSFAPPERDAPSYQVDARFRLDETLLDGGTAPFPLPGGLGAFGRPGRLLLGSGVGEDGTHLCYPGKEVETVAFTLPDGASLRAVPPDVSVAAGGAEYRASYRVKDGVLLVHREFAVTASRVACAEAEYAAMRRVLDAAKRDQRVQLALDRER